ncbi:13945_t:CDS:2 [Rhizophagus irregularis]|nr:13945_t:CDS:2 [Rhizophagus irregularis]
MMPPCPKCGKNNFKSTRDRNTHLNHRIPCIPKITEVISYPETIPEPSEVGNNLPNNLKYGGISSVEELKATIDELASQIKIQDLEETMSQHTASTKNSVRNLQETLSQHTASTKKSVRDLEETISQYTALSSKSSIHSIPLSTASSKTSQFTYDPTIADLEQTEEDKEMARLYMNQLLLLLRSCPLDIEEFKEGNNMLQWLFANNIIRDDKSFCWLSALLYSPKPTRISLGNPGKED